MSTLKKATNLSIKGCLVGPARDESGTFPLPLVSADENLGWRERVYTGRPPHIPVSPLATGIANSSDIASTLGRDQMTTTNTLCSGPITLQVLVEKTQVGLRGGDTVLALAETVTFVAE